MANDEKRLQYSAEEIDAKLSDITTAKGTALSLTARLNGIDSTISEKASVTTANNLQNQINVESAQIAFLPTTMIFDENTN